MMTSTATIQKWGNSHGVRLSKQILEAAGIVVDVEPITVEISVEESGSIKITKAKKRERARRNIDELFIAIQLD